MRAKRLIILAVVVILAAVGFFIRGPLPPIQLPAEKVFSAGGFTVTNTILAAWVTIIVLTLLSYFGTRDMQMAPKGLQNLVELVVEMFLGLCENVAGKRHGRRFFPVVATILLFILVSNWMGLLPGYGAIGAFEPEENGAVFNEVNIGGLTIALLPIGGGSQTSAAATKPVAEAAPTSEGTHGTAIKEAASESGTAKGIVAPFLRSAATDINTPLALALMSAIFVEYWGVSTLGFRSYAGKFINVRQLLQGKLMMGFIDMFVGILELISEIVRIVSFTFRLFGNIIAGEILLTVLVFLVPWVLEVPFYGLELFFGFIQAFIFAMLTLIFGVMAVTAHEAGHEAGHAQEGHS